MPEISILIPAYNCSKTIKRCLNSVLEQTYKDIEIIIINDGSSDDTLAIIEQIKEKNPLKTIKIIDKKNTGFGHSINSALEYAEGKYIAILEADDWIEKDAYKIMSEFFGKYEIIKASFNFIKNNRIFKTYNLYQKYNGSKESLILLKPSIWSALYNKRFLDKYKIRFLNTQGAGYQDTSFHFKTMALVDRIKLINTPLYNYTIDTNTNSSINSNSKTSELLKEFEEINNFINQNFQLEKFYSNKILFEYRAYFWKFLRLENKEKLNFLKKIALIFKNYDLEKFYLDDKILTIDKLKMKFLTNHTYLFYLLFKNLKGRNDR